MLAIMQVENERIAKFADFPTDKEALEHVAAFKEKFPDAFVAEKPEQGGVFDWRVDNGTLVYDPPPGPTEEEINQKIESAILHSDFARLAFEIWFDQENRMRDQEGKASITKAQYRDALIARWKSL